MKNGIDIILKDITYKEPIGIEDSPQFLKRHSYLNDSTGLAHAAFRVCEATAKNAVNNVKPAIPTAIPTMFINEKAFCFFRFLKALKK